MISIEEKLDEHRKWVDKIRRTYNPNGLSHFFDITGNLGSILCVNLRDGLSESKVQRVVSAIDTYEKLIEQYPDFREGEFKTDAFPPKGFFPDISSAGGGAEHYVFKSAESLGYLPK